MQNTGIDLFDNDDYFVSILPQEFDLLDDLGETIQDDLDNDITDDTAP